MVRRKFFIASIADCLILPAASGMIHWMKEVIPCRSDVRIDLMVLRISASCLFFAGLSIPGVSIIVKLPTVSTCIVVVTALVALLHLN